MSKRFPIPALTLVLIALVGPAGARADGEPKTHDGGFIRISAGAGPAHSSIGATENTEGREVSGPAIDYNLAFGSVIAPNLALHGTFWGWTANRLEVSTAGLTYTPHHLTQMLGVGVGLTYYVMPANVYFSGSVGPCAFEAGVGVLTDLTVGKEWWVGGSWGLGMAGGFSYHSVGDPHVDANWSGTSFALRFSATLN